jgi:hypothetical protein
MRVLPDRQSQPTCRFLPPRSRASPTQQRSQPDESTMKRVLLACALAMLLVPTTVGCYSTGRHGGRQTGDVVQSDGPAPPTYVYPYYTTRAPRDFLLDNPPGIGP